MSELQRYGLEWKSDTDFIAAPMSDGYWTPWHIAQERLTTAKAENEALRAQLKEAEEKGRVLMDMCRFWKARTAQMHEAAHELYAWCVENLTAEQIKEGLPAGHKIGQLLEFERPAVEAFVLRKQAEAVEHYREALGMWLKD